jgi:hypothetical protein
MMTASEKALMFEVLFSTQEWAGSVKLPPTANRKIVLLFILVVEEQIKNGTELFSLFPKGMAVELQGFVAECLEKAGLKDFHEKLKALK